MFIPRMIDIGLVSRKLPFSSFKINCHSIEYSLICAVNFLKVASKLKYHACDFFLSVHVI